MTWRVMDLAGWPAVSWRHDTPCEVLLTDSTVVGSLGVLVASHREYGGIARAAGAALALSAVEVGLASRWPEPRMRVGAAVTATLAFGWAAYALPTHGPLRWSGLATLAFGTVETALLVR